MRILLTGGTGLIGRALCQHLQQQGHELWVWSRQPAQVPSLCSGARGVAHLQELNAVGPFDAVINLAGAPIADRPWTKSRRALLWQSRIDLTHKLVAWMGQQPTPPRVLLSASAVGWYGDRADACLDESSSPGGQDFGSRLCMAWEEEAQRAAHAGTRVALLRIAPVLASRGGMLARLLLPFKLGLGGRLGSGAQWMPWIHIEDLARLFDHLLLQANASGAYNACAPELLRNAAFTRTLAHTLHRPALMPAPAWALRLALGEMSTLLLGGQRLEPRRTQASGFVFRHPALAPALADLLNKQ